jgi:dipeptidyl aminopeptidase/acylaminoacyl peptidase
MPRAPFGTWPSSIQAEDLVVGAVAVGFPVQAGDRLLWQESRPQEAGRVAIVSGEAGGAVRDVLPVEMSARTSLHEYGGLCWAAGGPGGRVVVSVNHEDQRLWLVEPGRPRPLTPPAPQARALRYGAPVITPDGAWVVAIREVHTGPAVDNDLVAVPTGLALASVGSASGALTAADAPVPPPTVVASGHDFYSWPTVSPDGRQLAYVAWDLPAMPWDATSLWVCQFADGRAGEPTMVAGGESVSVLQPKLASGFGGESAPSLAWISDATGWWAPYCDGDVLCREEADFARAAWALGDSDYARLPSGAVMATWRAGGRSYLGQVTAGRAVPFDLPFTEFSQLSPYAGGLPGLPPGAEGALGVAAGPDQPAQLIAVSTSGHWSVLRRSGPAPQLPGDVSVGEHVRFPATGGEEAHAIFYPPRLAGWDGPEADAPPLIVTSHGGPTGQATTAYELRTQFWTSRGFAVVDVDYRGSTGYGRSYRSALEGRWGVADVDDCVAAAQCVGEQGRADAGRVVLRGSSSSGLSVLAALARYPWLRAGIARYPVCDLAEMADAHKFESRYLERLVPAGQVWARSPIHFADAIKAPVLFLHGSDDRVVPCASTRRMVDAIRSHGAEPGLVVLEGEGHGFRQAANIARSQALELAFACQALGIEGVPLSDEAEADLQRCRKAGGAFWPAPPQGRLCADAP